MQYGLRPGMQYYFYIIYLRLLLHLSNVCRAKHNDIGINFACIKCSHVGIGII